MAEADHAKVSRHRTAIRRVRCSRPIALALADGVVGQGVEIFDYGCGHGGDVKFLTARGITASGWDPHFAPNENLHAADVVNLGYVLNVIEDVAERARTLGHAFSLAKKLLVVSVRVDGTLDDAEVCGDGVITGKGTFQKIFTHSEFKGYVESALKRRMHTASLGIGYVFKDDGAEQTYIASKAFTRRLEYRTDLIASFEKDRVAKKYLRLANKLGRVPWPEEFPDYALLLAKYGSEQRIERLLLGKVDREAYEGSRAERRNDMLVYLAMLKLQGIAPPPYRALPSSVQADVKAIWSSYERAVKDGTDFLFSLGRPEGVKLACAASTVGKLLPGDLYVHRSAEDELPALLRVVLFAAKRIVGELTYELAKIAVDGRAVAFLSYPGFDEIAHPALARSVRVYLPKASFEVRDYRSYANPPILHRKDALVAPTYTLHPVFRALTDQEESLGLLSAPGVGFREAWESLLNSRRLVIDGHQVRRLS
jgi:DNA phosphorothioation-associated putative methyltransferase